MNRPDFSNFVVHFTKDTMPCSRPITGITGTALQKLESMLRGKTIISTPMPWTNKNAVAFTECPFWSLIDHARKYSPYGIGFTKAHLFASYGGPAIYLRPDLLDKQQVDFQHRMNPNQKGLHPELFAFVTPFIPPYAPQTMRDEWQSKHDSPYIDYSHEREWRVPHSFTFEYEQVQFVILKSYEDMAQFPNDLKDSIGRDKFILMDMYEKIEYLWPTHRIED